RIAKLSAQARFLADAQALAFYETFTDQDYHLLAPELGSIEIERALSELLAAQALVRDGSEYRLTNRVWIAALSAELDPAPAKRCHSALAAMYRAKASFAGIHHAFLAGEDQEALEALDTRNEVARSEADYVKLVEQNVGKLVWVYPRAIATAQRLGHSAR